MPTHVALLRGINVGGHNRVAMSDLRGLLGDLGFTGVKSLLQTGNLVFTGHRTSASALERLLERETARHLGVAADYLVRSAPELRRIVARNPFPKEAKRDPGHLVVKFLKDAPEKKELHALRASIQGRETIRQDGQQLYIVYPDGIGRSKLTGTLIERTLGTRATARNWNTVQKLLALCK